MENSNSEMAEENLYGMVVRLENILNGANFNKLEKLASKAREQYLKILSNRIEKLKNNRHEPEVSPEEVEKEELYAEEYDANIDFLQNRMPETYSYEERCYIYELYDNIINSMFGPHEYEDKKLWIAETFSREEVVSDIDILKGVRDFLIKNLPKPKSKYLEDKISELEKLAKRISGYNDKQIALAIDRNVLFENYHRVINILRRIALSGHSVDLIIDYNGFEPEKTDFNSKVPYEYNEREYEILLRLNESGYLKSIRFSEFFREDFVPFDKKNTWSFYKVCQANFDVMRLAQNIRSEKFSPFEALLFMNIYIDNFNYYGMATTDEKTRTFLTAEKSKNKEYGDYVGETDAFVCTGYGSFGKATIDAYNDNNIKCMPITISFYRNKEKTKKYFASHTALLVYLKDNKYGIDGYYIWDPTWAVSNDIQFVLFPVGDLSKYKKYNIMVDHIGEYNRIQNYLFMTRTEGEQGKTLNTLEKEFAKNGTPIKIRQYYDALVSIYTDIENSSNYHSDSLKLLTPSEIALSTLNYTICNLTSFDPENAENGFYQEIREYFDLHSDEYPNWQKNWNKYLNDIIYKE